MKNMIQIATIENKLVKYLADNFFGCSLTEEELKEFEIHAEEIKKICNEELLLQARRVRNYSNPEDVYEAVPVNLIKDNRES